MESSEAAATAKEALNGKEMDGRKIEVCNYCENFLIFASDFFLYQWR